MDIRTTQVIDDAARSRILDVLDAEADAVGHPFVAQRMLFEAWDGDTWCGGLTAKSVMDWMFVELLAVAANARGQGVGRDLMRSAENHARAQGYTGVWLDTFTFQAPGFYHKLGYSEFGHIPDAPMGQSRHFLLKRLSPPSA